MAIIEQLASWLQRTGDRQSSGWIEDADCSIYVRCSWRYLGRHKKVRSLEIANVTVRDTGKGYFTRLLGQIEEINPYSVLFVESVLQKRFQDFFLRRGYWQYGDLIPMCFYKIKANSK